MPSEKFQAALKRLGMIGLVIGAFFLGKIFDGRDQAELSVKPAEGVNSNRPDGRSDSPPHRERSARMQELPGKASDRTADKQNLPFPELPEQEQVRNLTGRLETLREDLMASEEPGKLISSYLDDFSKMNSFQKMAMGEMLEKKLAELDPNDPAKFAWISQLYPEIESSLQSRTRFGPTHDERLFGLLYSGARRLNIDIISEIKKIPNSESGKLFKSKLISELIVRGQDPHPELVGTMPAESRRDIQQRVMEVSARLGLHREEALNLYLSGKGSDGNHEELVSKWFQDPAWFRDNRDEVANEIANAPPGGRRDTVLEQMVSILNDSDSENARQWAELVADPEVRESLKAGISSGSERQSD